MQRLLVINYHRRDTSILYKQNKGVKEVQREWPKVIKMMSCLQPDLEMLRWKGKLDEEAIMDCATFVNALNDTCDARNADLHGLLAYFMLVLEVLSQCADKRLEEVFEYIAKESALNAHIATKHSSVLNQFILAIERVRQVSANPLTAEDRVVHHHNYRTTERPQTPFGVSVEYVAVHLEAMCNVIKRVLNEAFKPEELRRAVKDSDGLALTGRARFFDVATYGFPITKSHIDEHSTTEVKIPLAESELLDSTLVSLPCIYFRKTKYREIIDDVQTFGSGAPNYKSITIDSANADFGEYNFYEAVMGTGDRAWFGWRVYTDMAFGKYVGATNEVPCISNEPPIVYGMEDMLQEWGDFDDMMKPSNLLKYYNFDSAPDPRTLPPCLKINPYVFRNHPDDHMMPDDPRSSHYHDTFEDTYDVHNPHRTPKRGRDYSLRSGESTTPDSSRPSSKRSPGSDDTRSSRGGYERADQKAAVRGSTDRTRLENSLTRHAPFAGQVPPVRRPGQPVDRPVPPLHALEHRLLGDLELPLVCALLQQP